MSEMNGRYEHGRWVPDPVPIPEAKQEPEVKLDPIQGSHPPTLTNEMNGRYERGRWVQGSAPAPAAKPEQAVKQEPVAKPEPVVKSKPVAKPAPEVKQEPEAKPEQVVIQEPEVKTEPEVKSEPEVKLEPEVTPEPEEKSEPAAPTIEAQVHEASRSVRKAVNDVMNAGHRLLGTPEGHEQIEQAARKAGEDLERAINAWAESARRALKRR